MKGTCRKDGAIGSSVQCKFSWPWPEGLGTAHAVFIVQTNLGMVYNHKCTLHTNVVSYIPPYSLRLCTLTQVLKRSNRQQNLGMLPRFALDLREALFYNLHTLPVEATSEKQFVKMERFCVTNWWSRCGG